MWHLAGQEMQSRLILGSGRYDSPQLLLSAIQRSKVEIVTVSLRRMALERAQGRSQDLASGAKHEFLQLIRSTGVAILPNTASCRSAKEAVVTAHMAREVFGTHWIKLETVGDEATLQPDPFALVEAARILVADGFEVFPYTTEDLVVNERLLAAGCRILMPWGSPIGTGRGLANVNGLKMLRQRFPEVTLIVDAGLGAPSHAAHAMELGFDAVLLNTAVSQANDPPAMAEAFATAVQAGRGGYEAGLMQRRDLAMASSPTIGLPFWKAENSVSEAKGNAKL